MKEELGRLSGVIAGIVREKNYGFISPDDKGKQLFFHSSAVDSGDFGTLRPGMRVTYVPLDTDKGIRAVNVEVL